MYARGDHRPAQPTSIFQVLSLGHSSKSYLAPDCLACVNTTHSIQLSPAIGLTRLRRRIPTKPNSCTQHTKIGNAAWSNRKSFGQADLAYPRLLLIFYRYPTFYGLSLGAQLDSSVTTASTLPWSTCPVAGRCPCEQRPAWRRIAMDACKGGTLCLRRPIEL